MKDENGFAVPFDIEVREFSAQIKAGGKYKVYNGARLLASKPKHGNPKGFDASQLFLDKKERKNPNHFLNHTRNLELANGEKKKINIRFIIKFNHKNVIY